jgi:hypothetical protein
VLKQKQRDVPVATPRKAKADVDAGYERATKRFPKIIARLGK